MLERAAPEPEAIAEAALPAPAPQELARALDPQEQVRG
jgi:hypothetical protein